MQCAKCVTQIIYLWPLPSGGAAAHSSSVLASPAWALEMSLMRPSYFLYFREIGEKQSNWPGSQSAPSCSARLPQISLHLYTTSWWFNNFNLALKHHLLGNSNCCVWFSFTLGLHKWPDSDKCLKWATLICNNGWPSWSSATSVVSVKLFRKVLCLFCRLVHSTSLHKLHNLYFQFSSDSADFDWSNKQVFWQQ